MLLLDQKVVPQDSDTNYQSKENKPKKTHGKKEKEGVT